MPRWLHDPPCQAEKLLADMFKKGEITSETTASQAQALSKVFGSYSTAVFYNNFKRHRLLSGLECTINKF